MSDDLNTKGRIELEVVSNVKQAISDLEEYISTTDKVDPSLKRLAKSARDAIDGIGGQGKAAKGAAQANAKYADGFDELIKKLNEFNRAQREAAQANVVGGSLDGKNRGALEGMSTDTLKRYIAIDDARGQNAVSVARDIVAARQRETAATERAVQQSIAAIQRETAAYSAAYSTQAAAAAKVDQQIAAQRAAQRYATVPNASRNTATPGGAAAAQAEYSAQELAALNASYRQLEQSSGGANKSLISTRYALYDVATTAGLASAALLATSVATVGMAAKYETSFTSVDRTTLASADTLSAIREQLLGLARDIPLAFADITQIASLGAQLGVADSDLAGFSETVARFSAVTNVGVDTAAQSFGALGTLLRVSAADYDKLGSSIAYVGVNSVATESEILAMATRLAASANNAGFAASEVIALSGALASLRVAPERAQGVMEIYFKKLNNAIADGGPRLERFAEIAGVTADKVATLVRQDPNAFFRSLAVGLGKLADKNPVLLTKALDDLGLSGIRAGEVFTRVSKNVDVFDRALSDANSAYSSGTFLAEVYAKKVDDIASRFQILQNSLNELAATAGSALFPILGPIIDGLSEVANRLSDLIATPVGQWLTGVGIGASAIVGSLLGLVAVVTLNAASFLALRTVVQSLGWSTATTGMTGFIAGMLKMGVATGGAATALGVFRVALATTGIGLAVVLLGTLAAAFMNVGQTSEKLFTQTIGSTAGLADAIAADTAAYTQAIATGNQKVADSFVVVDRAVDQNKSKYDEATQTIVNTATVLGTDIPNAFDGATDAAIRNTAAIGDNTIAWLRNQLMQSDSFKELAGNADFLNTWQAIGADFATAAKIAATEGEAGVHAYFDGLAKQALASGAITASAIQTSNAIISQALGQAPAGWGKTSFGGQAALGQFAKLLGGLGSTVQLFGFDSTKAGKGLGALADGGDDASNSMGKLAKSIGGGGGAAKQVRTLVDYANDLSGVFSRSFDIRFGGEQGLDTVAKGWSSIRDAIDQTNQKISDYQATMASLTADKAVKEYWLSVAENYGDALRAGELRADLAKIDGDLTKTSKDLAKAQDQNSKSLVGTTDGAIANRAEILGLVSDYQDYLKALAASGMSQVDLQAKSKQLKDEFVAQATQLGFNAVEVSKYAKAFDDMGLAISRVPRNITVTADMNPAIQAMNEFVAKARTAGGSAGGSWGDGFSEALKPALVRALGRTPIPIQGEFIFTNGAGKQQVYQVPGTKLKLFRDGGYTGDASASSITGVTHGKEFVFSAPATANIGVENLAFLHNMAKRGKGVEMSGSPATGLPYTQLSPFDRQLLIDIRDAIAQGLVVAPGALASAVGASNINSSNRRVS